MNIGRTNFCEQCARLADLNCANISTVADERDQLRARVEKLEAALRFYADSRQYDMDRCVIHDSVEQDLGARARQALGETE